MSGLGFGTGFAGLAGGIGLSLAPLGATTAVQGTLLTAPSRVLSPAIAPSPVELPGGRLEIRVTEELTLEAPAAYRSELRELAKEGAAILPLLEQELGARPRAPYRIYLIPRASERSRRVALLDSLAPAWAAGYLVADRRVGGIRLRQVDRYPYGDALAVLSHEVTHMLLHDAGGDRFPTWFEEGVATWQGRRWGLRDALVFSSNLLVGELPRLERLDQYFRTSSTHARVAYAASFDFVAWSVRHYGQGSLARTIDLAAELPFADAWQEATGVPLAESEARWRRGSIFVYRWLPLLSGSGTLWAAITALALLAGVRRRQRTRALLRRWEEEERRAERLAG